MGAGVVGRVDLHLATGQCTVVRVLVTERYLAPIGVGVCGPEIPGGGGGSGRLSSGSYVGVAVTVTCVRMCVA